MTILGLFNDGANVINAQILRQLAALFGDAGTTGPLDVASGVRITRGAPSALKVAAGVSGLTYTVQPGMALIAGTSTIGQGAYVLTSTAVETRTLATADGSQARYDRIIGKVTDTGDASSLYEITHVTGTPAGSPAIPATPGNAVSLGYILVPAGASTPGALTVTDDRLPIGTLLRPHAAFGMNQYDLTSATSTTSTSFTIMSRGNAYKRYPNMRVSCVQLTGTSTAAEIRLVVGGTQIAITTTAAGSGAFDLFGAIPGDYGFSIAVEVQARVLSGPGAVSVRVLSAAQVN